MRRPSASWLDEAASMLSLLIAGITVLFLLGPLVVVVVSSFGQYVQFPPQEWTLAAYRRIPPLALRAFGTSVQLAVTSALIAIVLSFPAALAITRGRLPGRALIETILRSPIQFPAIVLGIAFFQFYVYVGQILGSPFLGTFTGILIAHILIVAPYVLVALVVRMSRLSPEIEEAAVGLGAGSMRTAARIVFPLMRPAMIAGGLLAAIISFSDIAVTLFLVGGGQITFPVYLFGSAEVSNSAEVYAASTIGTAVSITIAVVLERFVGLRSVLGV